MALFGLNNTVDVHQQEKVNAENIEILNIVTSSAAVEVVPATGDEIEVLLDGKMSEKLIDNYSFKIIQKANRLEISFKTNHSNGFHFGITYIDIKLKVSIPEKIYEDIQVRTSSGGITINDVKSKTLTSTSSSGSQTITGVQVNQQLFSKASSGSIIAKENNAGKALLSASSGKIVLRELACSQTKLETSSGSIYYHNESLNGDLDCKASSGKVDINIVKMPESLSLECGASSGKVNVRVNGLDFKEKANHRAAASRGTGENSIYARTSSGSITVQEG